MLLPIANCWGPHYEVCLLRYKFNIVSPTVKKCQVEKASNVNWRGGQKYYIICLTYGRNLDFSKMNSKTRQLCLLKL